MEKYVDELSLGSISRYNNQQFHYNHVGGWRGVVSYWGSRIIGQYYSRDRNHVHIYIYIMYPQSWLQVGKVSIVYFGT